MSFVQQINNQLPVDQSAIGGKIDPENRFVKFLLDNLHLGDEVRT